ARKRSTTPSSMSAKRTRWPRSRSARPVARPTTPAPTPRTRSVWTSSSSLMTSGTPARSWVREPIAKPYAQTPVPVQGKGSAGRYVLVQAEEVVGVVALLERLQPVVAGRPIGLADALLALVHEEVHVHARVVGLQRGPEPPGPLALLVEPLRRGGRGVHVDREAARSAVEGGLVLADPRDRPAQLEARERRERRRLPLRVVRDDVDDVVRQLTEVGRAEVVPLPGGERGVEHRLV